MKFVFAFVALLLALPQVALADQPSWVGDALGAKPSAQEAALQRSGVLSQVRTPVPETGSVGNILISFVSASPLYTKGEPCWGCVVPTGTQKLDAYSFGLSYPYPVFTSKSTYVIGSTVFTNLGYTGNATLVYALLNSKGTVLAKGQATLSGLKSGYSYFWLFALKRPAVKNTVVALAAEIVNGKQASNLVQTLVLLQ